MPYQNTKTMKKLTSLQVDLLCAIGGITISFSPIIVSFIFNF